MKILEKILKRKTEKTLKSFLLKKDVKPELFKFAKDLTLPQFLDTCPRGDWILWLFAQTNPKHKKELITAAALCANSIRHLMTSKDSTDALDYGLKYTQNIPLNELKLIKIAAESAASDARSVFLVNYVPSDSIRIINESIFHATRVAAIIGESVHRGYYYPSDICNSIAKALVCNDVTNNAARQRAWVHTFGRENNEADIANAACFDRAQSLAARICNFALPLEIWHQSKI